MLSIIVPATEMWDEERCEFVNTKEQELRLEHSLVSISKWESKWHKVFLDDKTDKTREEILDYVKCMTLTQNVDPDVYLALSEENFREINAYIENPMSATFFREQPGGSHSKEPVTSELIYYWMVALQIPFECQKWHINRLLTLIRICGLKNSTPKKMSKRELMNRNRALNAARKKQLGTHG